MNGVGLLLNVDMNVDQRVTLKDGTRNSSTSFVQLLENSKHQPIRQQMQSVNSNKDSIRVRELNTLLDNVPEGLRSKSNPTNDQNTNQTTEVLSKDEQAPLLTFLRENGLQEIVSLVEEANPVQTTTNELSTMELRSLMKSLKEELALYPQISEKVEGRISDLESQLNDPKATDWKGILNALTSFNDQLNIKSSNENNEELSKILSLYKDILRKVEDQLSSTNEIGENWQASINSLLKLTEAKDNLMSSVINVGFEGLLETLQDLPKEFEAKLEDSTMKDLQTIDFDSLFSFIRNVKNNEALLHSDSDKLNPIPFEDLEHLLSLLQEMPEEMKNQLQLEQVETNLTQLLDIQNNIYAELVLLTSQQMDSSSHNNLFSSSIDSMNWKVSSVYDRDYLHLVEHTTGIVTENSTTKFGELWDQVKPVLMKLESNGTITTTEQLKLLKLLEQWTKQEQVSGKTELSMEQSKSKAESKMETVWNQVLNTYRKRNLLQMNQRYQSNSTVTSSDVTRWIKDALSRYSSDESTNVKPTLDYTINSYPVSKIEQYVIHMNQGSSNQAQTENQLLEKFQSILISSRFLANNGSKQLFLKLSPENLGDMMVKMTQINGEMVVKISVTSQMAKDMLEGNLQQLKHMFSPQQVVVEKQETIQQDSYQPSKQSDQNQSSNQSNQSNQDDSGHSDSNGQQDEEQGKSFYQILMNEKV